MSHMHANLMRSTRFQIHCQISVMAKSLFYAVVRHCTFTITCNGHFCARMGVASDGLVHLATSREGA